MAEPADPLQSLPAHPGAGPAPAPVPAPPPPPAEETAALFRRLDAALVVLVLAFAFLVASYKARNSDFFEHLAVGRLVAQGQYPFGADPFTVAGETTGWVNHSWLYGLLMYAAYTLSPAAPVVVKALMALALAVVMLATARQPGRRLWVPAVLTAVAVLAISPRLTLQPAVVSLLFLGVALWVLEQPRLRAARGEAPSTGAWWLLPPLFVLWVNLDQWFFFGLGLVALYLLGELIDRSERVYRLLLIEVCCVAACLVNPYHVRAFALPPQLGLAPGMDALQGEELFRSLTLSPFQSDYWQPGRGWNVAGLAYFPLALLGVVSFAVNGMRPAWRPSVWLGFFLVSFLHARAIPFFAVVAAPVTALNFLDAAGRLGEATVLRGRTRHVVLLGRVASILGAVLLVAGAGTGQLQARSQDRRVGWRVEADPLLEQAARKVAAWQEEGRVPPGAKWFNTHPDVAHYLAWFSPGARAFMDLRLPENAEAAADYVAARKALAAQHDADSGAGLTEPAWRDVFRKWGVRYLVLYEAEPLRHTPLLAKLLSGSGEWALLTVDGRAIVFAWQDPAAPDPAVAAARLDLDRLAFGPSVEPLRGPGPEVTPPPTWWAALTESEPPPSPAGAEAVAYLALFEALTPARRRAAERAYSAAWVAALAAGAGGPGGPLGSGTLDRARFASAQQYLGTLDDGPPAALYLAVRHARRAIADNPRDARPLWVLAQAYRHLSWSTRERAPAMASPYLRRVRRAQAAAALQRALALRPNLEIAHRILAQVYYEESFHDLWIQHRRAALELARHNDAAGLELAQAEEQLKADEKELGSVRDRFALQSANQSALGRAQAALQFGLGGEALDILRKARPEDLDRSGNPQARARAQVQAGVLLLRLLMATGRLDEARPLLAGLPAEALDVLPELQVPERQWYQLLLAAADGDYERADDYAADLLQAARHIAVGQRPPAGPGDNRPDPAAVGGLLLGQYLLREGARAGGFPDWAQLAANAIVPREQLRASTLESVRRLRAREASLRLLRGALALEAGDLPAARAELQRAARAAAGPANDRPVDPAARAAARMYLGWLDAAR